MSDNTNARRTVASLARPTTIPYLGIEKADALVLIAGGMLGLFGAFQFQAPGLLVIPTALAGVGVGGVVLYAKPSTLTGTDYLRVLFRYVRMPARITPGATGVGGTAETGDPTAAEADPAADETEAEAPSGGVSGWIEVSMDTTEVPMIERYHPGQHLLERDDGRYIGGLHLTPRDMDFAEVEDWVHIANVIEQFVNDELSFPIQLYATTREFPMAAHIEGLEERLADPDVEQNPQMEAVIESLIEQRQAHLSESDPSPVHFYVITEVGEEDVLTDAIGEATGLEKLAGIPLLGLPIRLFVTGQTAGEDSRLERRLREELDRRLTSIATGWPTQIEGMDSRRLRLAEWLPLLEEFWQGHHRGERAPEMVRTAPFVSGESFAADSEAVAIAASVAADEPRDGDSDEASAADPARPGETSASGADDTDQAPSSVADHEPEDQGAGPDSDGDDSNGDTAGADQDTAVDADESAVEALPALEAIHQQQLAPEGLAPGFDTIELGEEVCQVLYVPPGGWDDPVNVAALRRIFTRPDLEFDLAFHVEPMGSEAAVRAAKRRYQSCKADAGIEESDLTADERLSDAGAAKNFYEQVKDGQRPLQTSLYVVVRASDEAALRDMTRTMRSEMAMPPANLTLNAAKGEQLRALQSASPVGRNVLREYGRHDPTELMLGRGVASVLASPKDAGRLDAAGIELGRHARNGKPLIFDPFATDENYNWVVVGDSGAGKTYSSAAMTVREWARAEDRTFIFIDPMKNFEGVARAMDAEIIRAGGQQLNPLELRPPSGSAAEFDHDPLTQKIQDVLSLFDNFAYQQGLTQGLGEHRSVLASAIEEAYRSKNITYDVATHHRESPTIRDVFDELAAMADPEDPADVVVRTEKEAAGVSDSATYLLKLLRPFVDGPYEHLADESQFDLGDNDVIYVDMSSEEGKWGGGGGLLMQLVFSLVYERAKATPDEVVIVIDEARFFMRHSENLSFLGQRVRHSRHFDTSIRFVTQELNDFFDHDESEAIWNNSAVKWFHNLDEIEQWQDTFGLNDKEVSFVQAAKKGQVGYSEALVDIEGARYPVQVSATADEDTLIEFEAGVDGEADLPGSEAVVSAEIERFLQQLKQETAGSAGAPEAATEQLEDVWASLPRELKATAGILSPTERLAFVQDVAAAEGDPDPWQLVAERVGNKLDHQVPGVDGTGITEAILGRSAAPGETRAVDGWITPEEGQAD